MRIGHGLKALVLAAWIAGGAGIARGADFIWIEGESPSAASFEAKPFGSPVLSGGQWLNYTDSSLQKKDVPKPKPGEAPPSRVVDLPKPLSLKYEFQAKSAGEYEFWVRVGYEKIRAPLQWRVDEAAWSTLAAEAPTQSLMRVGLWCEVAWAKAGRVRLEPGKHTLNVQCTQSGSDGRVLAGLDCAVLVLEERWTPEGWLKPGQGYDGAIDREAEAKVFRLPAGQGQAPARVELPLDGAWQVARYDDPAMAKDAYEPVKTLPKAEDGELRWRGIAVPGDSKRPELVFGHRLVYQTRIDVPAAFSGRSFQLHFSGTCWIVGVFVNGQYVGGHKSVLVPWDIDITKALKPGQVNTIALAVKDWYYSMDPASWLHGGGKDLDAMRNTPVESAKGRSYVAPVYPSSKGEGSVIEIGILRPIKLVVAGPSYTSDTFVRTSVADKRLDATVSVTNSGGAPAELTVQCEAVYEKTGKAEKAFPPVQATVAPGATAAVQVGGPWAEAKLWWPAEAVDDLPDCYLLKTTILAGGKPVDVRLDRFGFRQVSIRGKDLLLNGVVWHLWNWIEPQKAANEKEWLAGYHAENDRYHRVAADHDEKLWGTRERALDFFDRSGIPGRLSTCIDGMFINHNLDNPLVWENFAEHVRQMVLAYRNHPSVLMYSLENELIFITATLRFRPRYEQCEDRFMELCKLARQLDPTRPSFGDGAGDLRGQAEINCQHYAWPKGEGFPAEAYAYDVKGENQDYAAYRKAKNDRESLFIWDGKRPLIGGEEFFYSGNLSGMAWIGGPDVFRGKKYADKAGGLYALISAQAARWQGVAGFCPWTVALGGADPAWQPRAVFVREWNSALFGGGQLKRTIKVFNDTRRDEPLAMKWRLMIDGKEAAAGAKTYAVPPGQAQEDTLTATLPPAGKRLDGQLLLELAANGKIVFTDSKPISVLPRTARPAAAGGRNLTVLDPEGSVRKWLTDCGVVFTALDNLDSIPTDAQVLVLGKDALTSANRKAAVGSIVGFAQAGKVAIVLEQKDPLEGPELPVPGIAVASQEKGKPARPEFRAAGGKTGHIAFPVAIAHPAFRGLTAREFFTWGGDELVYRLSYATPAGGVIGLLQAGEDLGLTPMMEMRVGMGSLVLSQALLAAKAGSDPVADRVLCNLLTWAGQRASARPGKTLTLLAGDKPLEAALARTAVRAAPAESVAQALAGDADIFILKASPQSVGDLAAGADKVKAFCTRGGWVVLCNLDPQGLASFNKLVGFEHRLRAFRREAVLLQERTDPLLMGLSDRDVSMLGDDMIAPWRDLYAVSSRVFTAVVDGEQVASFAQISGVSGNDGPTVLVDGLTQADFWKYIQYMKVGDKVDFAFDRPEVFTRLAFSSSPGYFALKDIQILFDGKDPASFTAQQTSDVQEVDFPPRKASTVSIQIKSHYPGQASQDLVQIDDVQMFRQMPKGWGEKVVMLSHPGGLVKYPIGKGGILLSQLDMNEAPADAKARNSPVNLAKKTAILSNLLRNMGASFGAELAAGK